MRRNSIVCMSGLTLAVIPMAQVAVAQVQTAPPVVSGATTQDDEGIEEIVVTAQKCQETAQDVPISITAFTAESLESKDIHAPDDLAAVTPGLSFGQVGPGSGTPFLRGVGSNLTTPGSEAAVSTCVDGVYVGSQYAPVLSLNNIQSIEIDKGPQGTLFGRNATGGVIQITTKDPSQDAYTNVEAGYANYKTSSGKFYSTAGITNTLAADIALYVSDQADGWGENLFTGRDVYTSNHRAARSKWLWAPGDTTKLTLSLDYSHDYSEVGTAGTIPEGQYLRPPGPAGNPGPYLSAYSGFYNTNSSQPAYSDSNQRGASLRVWQDLHFAQLVSISSYHRSQVYGSVDTDLTPTDWRDLQTNPGSETVTQELQPLSPNNSSARLKWIGGLFFYHDRATDIVNFIGPGYLPSYLPPGFGPATENVYQTSNSYAEFGQATYSIFKGTNLTLGARFTRDKRETAGTEFIVVPGVGPVLAAQTTQPDSTVPSPRTATFSKATYKISLDQHIGANTLAYGSYSTGFKSGVFNILFLNTDPVSPESVNAAGIGLKNEWLNHKLRENIAAFDEAYRNIQFTIFGSGNYELINAAGARTEGIDFDIKAAPIKNFVLTFSGELMEPRYSSFPNGSGYVPVPITSVNPLGGMGGFLVDSTDLSGKQMIQATKETLNLAADYNFALTGSQLSLTGIVQYSSKFFFDPQNGAEQSAFTQINSSAQWLSQNHKFYARLLVNNLMNNMIYANLTRSTTSDWAAPAAPVLTALRSASTCKWSLSHVEPCRTPTKFDATPL